MPVTAPETSSAVASRMSEMRGFVIPRTASSSGSVMRFRSSPNGMMPSRSSVVEIFGSVSSVPAS